MTAKYRLHDVTSCPDCGGPVTIELSDDGAPDDPPGPPPRFYYVAYCTPADGSEGCGFIAEVLPVQPDDERDA